MGKSTVHDRFMRNSAGNSGQAMPHHEDDMHSTVATHIDNEDDKSEDQRDMLQDNEANFEPGAVMNRDGNFNMGRNTKRGPVMPDNVGKIKGRK